MGLIDQRISSAVGRLRQARKPSDAMRVVIVGNGMVCQHLCDVLSGGGDERFRITVIGEERYPAYDRIHLSTIEEPERALLADQAWYRERGIELRLGCVALAIDREARAVLLESGESVPFDALVLATGSSARMPAIEGIALPNVFSYRTIDDVLRIRRALVGAKRAVIVGGGLLGLEAARLSLDASCETTLIEASRLLMPRQLDMHSAAVLQERVERMGVTVELDAQLQAIERSDAGLCLRLANERSVSADVVVIAIGVVPRDELARGAQLKVAARGGVLVDDGMRTSDPNVYAVGDCACHAGRSYGLVAPGLAMADVVAERLRGRRARFAGGDSSCELKLMGIPVSAVGQYETDAQAVAASSNDGRRTLLLRDRRLVGATAVGAWDEVPRIRALAEREVKISARTLARFERTGRLFPDDEPGIASWPASAVVCNCRRITKGELELQMKTCGADAVALSSCTGAGSVCGSCKPLLIELVGKKATPVHVPYTRALMAIAALVVLLVGALTVMPAPAYVRSVQHPWHELDVLRASFDFRQVTGFSIVGLAALSLVVSLRKRLNWFSRVSFGGVRALHALLGGLALVALVAHTGLRFGAGLNSALMICFVAAALLGGCAAVASASEASLQSRVARRARRARGPATWLHIFVLWPLPVLLGIHVLAAYYF